MSRKPAASSPVGTDTAVIGDGPGALPGQVSPRYRGWRARSKRALDLVLCVIGLVVAAPVMAVIALAILVANGRPVLFRQTRVGRRGEKFTMVKFRTMVPDAHDRLDDVRHHNERDGPLFKSGDDPRVTRLGKILRHTSLDELPQLANVLTGAMSLVGPRPALFEERDQFPPELLAREELPPGITGLWQVDGRLDADFGKYTELDLRYVHEWSLGLDLRILARTPWTVMHHAWSETRRVSHRVAERRAERVAVRGHGHHDEAPAASVPVMSAPASALAPAAPAPAPAPAYISGGASTVAVPTACVEPIRDAAGTA